MIRFGVIGAGRIGKVHSATIAANPKAKLVYIADAMPKAAEELAAKYGAKVASVDEIMKSKDVDAVLIGSPTGFHAEQIQAASNAWQSHHVRKAGFPQCGQDRGNAEGGGEEQVHLDDRLQSPLRPQLCFRWKPASARVRLVLLNW